jgi:hypothetical protein
MTIEFLITVGRVVGLCILGLMVWSLFDTGSSSSSGGHRPSNGSTSPIPGSQEWHNAEYEKFVDRRSNDRLLRNYTTRAHYDQWANSRWPW